MHGHAVDPRERSPYRAVVLDPRAAVERVDEARRVEPTRREVRGHRVDVEVDLGRPDRVQALERRDRRAGVVADDERLVDQATGVRRDLIVAPAPGVAGRAH